MPLKWVVSRNHTQASPFLQQSEFYFFDIGGGGLWSTTPFTTNVTGRPDIALRRNNDMVFIFNVPVPGSPPTSTGPWATVYNICKKGPWTTPVINPYTQALIGGTTIGRLTTYGLDLDGDETLHLIVGGSGIGMFDLRLDKTNTWLPTITISAPQPRSQSVVSMTYNRTADSIDIVTIGSLISSSIFDINFITGTPASNPTYTYTVIDTQTVYNGQMARIAISPDRNYPTRYVAYPMGDDGNGYQTEIRLATNSGSGWSNSLLWDFLADPPPVPAGVSFFGLQGVFAASMTDDGTQVHVCPFGDDFDNSAFSLAWYLKVGNSPPGNLILFDASGGTSGLTKPYFVGPIKNGSDLWIGMNPNRRVQTIGYFKSSDGGATWAEVDAAHSIPVGTFDVPVSYSTALLTQGCPGNRIFLSETHATETAGANRIYLG